MAAAAIVAACVLWIGSGMVGGARQPPPAPAVRADAPVRVGVVESRARAVTARLDLTGTTRPNRTVEVRAETRGRVAEVLADKGAALAAGAPIVRLAPDDRAARLARAEALFAQRDIEFQAASRLADKDYASRVRVATTRAEREAAAAELASARLDTARATIAAPFAGVLDARPVELGAVVAVDDAVATLVELNPILVAVEVSETAIGRVAPGAAAAVRLPGGAMGEGTVTYVGRVAAPATRTFRVEIAVPNPERRIAAGMTAEVSLPLGDTRAHPVSPAVLTLSDAGELGVKAVDDAGTVVFHPAQPVREDAEGLWLGGLPDALRLITVGQDFVSAGQRVEAAPDTLLAPPSQGPG